MRIFRYDGVCYCPDCYNRINHRAIQGYFIRPDPLCCSNGSCRFGIELEIDGAGEDSDNAKELLKFSRQTPRKQVCWAARYGYKEPPWHVLGYTKKGSAGWSMRAKTPRFLMHQERG